MSPSSRKQIEEVTRRQPRPPDLPAAMAHEASGWQAGHRIRVPWVCGLFACVAWSSMLLVIFRLPDLSSADEIVRFWQQHETMTQVVIVVMACGYPAIIWFLAGMVDLWPRSRRHEGRATTVMAYLFITALLIALGLASAAGQLIIRDPANGQVGYALHSGAFILAAPAAGLGAGFFVGTGMAALRGDLPRWLSIPSLTGLVCNLGPLGGHFALDGVWNTGNGLAGGMTLPVASVLLFVACVSTAQLVAGSGSRMPDERAAGARR